MKKIKLAKDYKLRHDIVICAGSEIIVSKNKANQLKDLLVNNNSNNKKDK
tara:strand:+ start:2518 stop:2667 length:150 start_codon:yes stop_codon:yes gene_type:complete